MPTLLKPSTPCPVPSFESKNARLYVGDTVSILPKLGSAFVDLFFADPPFNFKMKYGGGAFTDDMTQEAYREFTRKWVFAACRALKPGGSIFVNVPDVVVPYVFACLDTAGMQFVNWIVLNQDFGQYGESKFINGHVHLLYFAKRGAKRTWNVEEILEPGQRLEIEDPRIATAKYRGMRPMLDVWDGPNLGRVQGNNKERWNPDLHPNQLPELYLARVIRCASNPGDLIFDGFSGSGTTGTVARALGRQFWGIELVPESAASGWERITKRGPIRDVAGVLHNKESAGAPRGVNLSKL